MSEDNVARFRKLEQDVKAAESTVTSFKAKQEMHAKIVDDTLKKWGCATIAELDVKKAAADKRAAELEALVNERLVKIKEALANVDKVLTGIS